MADWIKTRKDLHGDPSVLGIAALTGVDVDGVVGKLHRIWSWADTHTTDGNGRNVTASWVDVLVGTPGFAEAMEKEGWLEIGSAGIRIPNFERHNGQSAKQRAVTANRVAKHRGENVTVEPLPEERREDKNFVTSDEGDDVDVGDHKNFDWDSVGHDATKLAAVLPWKKPADRSLILKSCYLSRAKFGEDWLWDSFEATRRKNCSNAASYFTNVLKEKTRKLGFDLMRLFKQIEVPKQLLNPPSRAGP